MTDRIKKKWEEHLKQLTEESIEKILDSSSLARQLHSAVNDLSDNRNCSQQVSSSLGFGRRITQE